MREIEGEGERDKLIEKRGKLTIVNNIECKINDVGAGQQNNFFKWLSGKKLSDFVDAP